MMKERITLVGYASKKQPYIFLVVSIFVFIMGLLFLMFADANDKYGSIICFLISLGFAFCFISELKQPDERIRIIEDKKIIFYAHNSEQIINLYDVRYVEYWPFQAGLKMRINIMGRNLLLSCMLKNSKEVKQYLLHLFDEHGIEVIKRYSTK